MQDFLGLITGEKSIPIGKGSIPWGDDPWVGVNFVGAVDIVKELILWGQLRPGGGADLVGGGGLQRVGMHAEKAAGNNIALLCSI